MGILTDIQGVKTISSTSTQGVITTSNHNFKILANALYNFLTSIEYSEEDLSIGVKSLIADVISSNSTISVSNDSGKAITLDSNGRIYADNSIRSKSYIESPMIKVDYLATVPKYGNGGEIVYARNSEGKYDFFGYVNEIGWVSLTEGGGEEPGPSPVPGGDGDALESWSCAVESIITELPSVTTPGKKYLVSTESTGYLAQYAGNIAYFDELSNEWTYVAPEDNSFVVVKDEGNAVYVSETNGDTISWKAPESSSTIGVDTEGLNKFSKDDTIGYVISVLDKEILDVYYEAICAFNATQGLSFNGVGAEQSKYITHASVSDIYADDVNTNNELVKATLTQIDEEGLCYSIDVDDVSRILSPSFGDFYAQITDSNDNEIYTPVLVQYNSGIVYFKELPETAPANISLYQYTGEFLDSKIGIGGFDNPDKNMHVESDVPMNNFSSTGLSTSISYNGYVDVKINGVSATVCDTDASSDRKKYDCYFSVDDGVTPISYNNGIPSGAVLYWNSVYAGYVIDTTDVVSFYYI